MIRAAFLLALIWLGAAGAWAWTDLQARTLPPPPLSTAELERACAARSYYDKPQCVQVLSAERLEAARTEALTLAAPGYAALGFGPALGIVFLGIGLRVVFRRRPPPPPAQPKDPLDEE